MKIKRYHQNLTYLHVKKLITKPGDFPDSPVVKTLPSKVEGASSIPTRRAKISYASWSKNQNMKKKPETML